MDSSKTGVILPANWPGNFRRTVRNAKGEAVKVLEFQPGQIAELDSADLEAIRGDMGVALFFAAVQDGKCLPKPDHKLTAAFVEETKAMRTKPAKKQKAAE